ncbi:MAG: DUF2726 domain-containing protein [Thermoguttaceae bacterium]|nr:DUF2726 domain-containing protein [Thermoguttaceae bacterium]
MLNLLAQETTEVVIPEPLTNVVHQLTMLICFAAVTIPVIILIILIATGKLSKLLESIRGEQSSVSDLVSKSDGGTENYKRKSCILTQTENEFYSQLFNALHQAGLDVIVWPQVNVSSIIESVGKDSQQRMKAFNRICRKSVDYVIVNKRTRETLVCIELDDYTHNRNSRKERDNFINSIFNNVGIPLLRIRAEQNYDFNEIVSTVKRMMK